MVRLLSLFICFLSISATFAQVGGKATYQFMNLAISPRQAALGGKVITNYDYDPTQGLFNPASINWKMDNQLSVNYNNYLGDVNYGTAAYAYLWDRRTQVLHMGATYINYGKFDGYDEQGNFTDTFSGGEFAFSVGHARNVAFTNFDNGEVGQILYITKTGGAIVQIINDNSDIHLEGSANLLLPTNAVVTLMKSANGWVQVAPASIN